jgi:hypothetical protein
VKGKVDLGGAEQAAMNGLGLPAGAVETIGAFLAADDEPERYLIPELLPAGVLSLWHGEPRARKSLAAFELALAAATGTAPFGLTRFAPPEAVPVLYVMEEDPRALTRTRLRALVHRRCGDTLPDDTLKVIIRRGVNLDDPGCVAWLIEQLTTLGSQLLVLDAARRLSAQTDEGPAKVRELTGVLRLIVAKTGVTIIIVHHDVKPPTTGQDQRRRSQRASGGDWFAACECPVHVEKIGARVPRGLQVHRRPGALHVHLRDQGRAHHPPGRPRHHHRACREGRHPGQGARLAPRERTCRQARHAASRPRALGRAGARARRPVQGGPGRHRARPPEGFAALLRAERYRFVGALDSMKPMPRLKNQGLECYGALRSTQKRSECYSATALHREALLLALTRAALASGGLGLGLQASTPHRQPGRAPQSNGPLGTGS